MSQTNKSVNTISLTLVEVEPSWLPHIQAITVNSVCGWKVSRGKLSALICDGGESAGLDLIQLPLCDMFDLYFHEEITNLEAGRDSWKYMSGFMYTCQGLDGNIKDL